MARKIPVRKHHGVRDPMKQRKEREEKLKHVLNAPPSKKEKVPKKIQKMVDLCKQVKDGEFRKPNRRRNKKKTVNPDGLPLMNSQKFMTTILPGEKNIRNLAQQPWETDRMFYERFQRLTNDVIKEAQFESKFKMRVNRDERGIIESLEKAPVNDVDKKGEQMAKEARVMAENPKRAKKLKAKAAKKAAAKTEKIAKLKNYRKMKREIRNQKILEKLEDAPVKDTVKFGEVVHCPPNIKVLPRKASEAPKDLRSLMFNQMLLEGKRKEEEQKSKLKGSTTNKMEELNIKGKWKNLPVGQRRILEDQQKNAIAAYRLMKANKAKEIPIK